MHVEYFNGLKISSNFKIVLFRLFYNNLMVTFHEKQGDRHEEISKEQVGLYL